MFKLYVIVFVLLSAATCYQNSKCNGDEYDPQHEGCCGGIIFHIEEESIHCRQAISVLLPTEIAPKDAEGIMRFQELPNNTLEIFVLTKNLDNTNEYFLVATEYGDLSTYNGSGLGDILGSNGEIIRIFDHNKADGCVGDIEFVNDYTTATTYVIDTLSLRGDESILGKGVAISIKRSDGKFGEIVLQGTIGLCGELCVKNYPINEAIINYENWSWYQPSKSNE